MYIGVFIISKWDTHRQQTAFSYDIYRMIGSDWNCHGMTNEWIYGQIKKERILYRLTKKFVNLSLSLTYKMKCVNQHMKIILTLDVWNFDSNFPPILLQRPVIMAQIVIFFELHREFVFNGCQWIAKEMEFEAKYDSFQLGLFERSTFSFESKKKTSFVSIQDIDVYLSNSLGTHFSTMNQIYLLFCL